MRASFNGVPFSEDLERLLEAMTFNSMATDRSHKLRPLPPAGVWFNERTTGLVYRMVPMKEAEVLAIATARE